MTQHIEHNTTLSRSAVCTLPSWNPNIKCTKAKDDVTNIIRNERINAKIEAFVYPVEDLTDLILDADLPCTNSYLGIVTFKVKQCKLWVKGIVQGQVLHYRSRTHWASFLF